MGNLNFIQTQSVEDFNGENEKLLESDELTKEIQESRSFAKFKESKITFAPTSKYTKGSKTLLPKSIPYYTDRILYQGNDIESKSYKSYPLLNNSGYHPVYLITKIKAKESILAMLLKNSKGVDPNISLLDLNLCELNDFIIKQCLYFDKRISIHKCINKYTKKEFSIHILKKKKKNPLNFINHIADIKSPFILEKKQYFYLDKYLIMVTDVTDHEDFITFLKRNFISEAEVKFYIAQVILGLKTLHKHNIIYRNLNLDNLKLFSNGYIKLSSMYNSKIVLSKTFSKFETNDYTAPEIILHTGHNRAVDFWSLGVLAYNMLMGYPPFFKEDDKVEFQKIERILNGVIEYPNFVSPQAKSFISSLLERDQSNRLGSQKGIEEIMNHIWLKTIDWNQIETMQVKAKFFPKKITNEIEDDSEIFKEFKKLIPEENISTESTTPRERIEKRKRSIKRSSSVEKRYSIFVKKDERTDSEPEAEEIFTVKDDYIFKKKKEILKEFIETEKLYVNNLQLLVNDFLTPMLNQKIVTPDIHQRIFSSIQTILKVNITFLGILEANIKNMDNLSKSIYNFIKSFKLYAPFIQNQNISQETLVSEKQKNNKLNNFLNSKYQQYKEKGIDYHINNLLMLPIQRIQRYEIYCQDLLNNTPLEEKELLEKAYKEMKEIVIYCNDKNKEYESSLVVFQIQRKYGITIDNTKQLLFEKSKEIVFYIDEGVRQLVNELIILNGYFLIELKSKKQVKLEFYKVNLKEYPELKEIEIISRDGSIRVGFEKHLYFEKYFEVFKNLLI